jgi:hypothetical protein
MNTYGRVDVGNLTSFRSLTRVTVAERTCGQPKTKHVFSFSGISSLFLSTYITAQRFSFGSQNKIGERFSFP